MRAAKYTLALVVFESLLIVPVSGQRLAPLPVEDVLRTHGFAQLTRPQFSPDGREVAFSIRDNLRSNGFAAEQSVRSGVPWNAMGVDIYVVTTTASTTRNVTSGRGNNWAPIWSPDGQYLAFLSDRDGSGSAKLWVWERVDDKMRKISDVNIRANEIQWLPNSRNVLVTVLSEKRLPGESTDRLFPAASQTKKENAKASGSTVVIYRSSVSQGTVSQSDPWSLESDLRDLASVDIATGTVDRLDKGHRISKVILSPDGLHVAFTIQKRFEKSGSQQILSDLAVIDLANKRMRVVASDIRLDFDASFSWSLDSTRLAYQTGGMEANGDCYVVDLNSVAARKVTAFARQTIRNRQWPPLWGANSQHIYFLNEGAMWKASVDGGKALQLATIPNHRIVQLVARGGTRLWSDPDGRSTVVVAYDDQTKESEFQRIDLTTGQANLVLKPGPCYTCLLQGQHVNVSPDGSTLIYLAGDAQHDTDLWLTKSDFSDPHRLTNINPQFEKYEMGAARLIEWRSLDGELLRGALLLPAGYQEGQRYPLIVNVYGGASLSNTFDRFGLGLGGPDNMQMLATRGYAVLLPDAPQHLGTPMADLAKTVLPGVDSVIELGIADPDRLGVMGHSYGGYSTLCLIVLTKRFRAALMSSGFGDLIAAYGQMGSDGSAYQTTIQERGQGLMGGTPWQFRERYIENSPIFYLNNVETPMLIVHGDKDNAVASFLADEVFVGLRRLGKEAVYAKYEGENHDQLYWSFANQVDYCHRMIEWFDEYLTNTRN